jgi:hypothetical protein
VDVTGDEVFTQAAAWPDDKRDLNSLAGIAKQAIAERHEQIFWTKTSKGSAPLVTGIMLATPFVLEDAVFAVVVVNLSTRASIDLPKVQRQLSWGAGWLEALYWQQKAAAGQKNVEHARIGLGLIAVAGEHRRFKAAALAVANELARQLACERVSVGMEAGREVRLLAMSHSATHRRDTRLADALETAMEETIDQGAAVAFPANSTTERRISAAHRSLATVAGARAALSVVMIAQNVPVGVVLLERHREGAVFTPDETLLAETVGALIGPILKEKRGSDRWLGGRILDASDDGLRALFGPRRPTLKLAAASVVLAAGALAVAETTHQVTA